MADSSAFPVEQIGDILESPPFPLDLGRPGWLVLFALGAVALVWLTYLTAQRWSSRRYLRMAVRELKSLKHSSDRDPRAWTELSAVLKSVAVRRFEVPGLAGLSGGAWQDFLKEHGFSAHPDDLPPPDLHYRGDIPTDSPSLQRCTSAAIRWIRGRHV